jgi:hypothetical protein
LAGESSAATSHHERSKFRADLSAPRASLKGGPPTRFSIPLP